MAQRAPSPDLVAQCCQHRDLVVRCCQPVVRGEPPPASAPAQFRAVQHRSAVPAAAAKPKAQRVPSPDLVAQCCQHRDLVARCCQPVLSGEPPHASAPAQIRAVKHRSAVPAAAAKPKAQRAPSPDLVAQCCQHRDLVAPCCQPVLRGEPPHASAPAPLRTVQRCSAVSAAAAEPKARWPPYPDLVTQCCQPVVRSEPRRSGAGASAPIRCTSISYCHRSRSAQV